MNDLQAFKVINAMPGKRRVMPFAGLFTDRYLLFFLGGRYVDVRRNAVTGLWRIVVNGHEIGNPELN